MFSLSVAFLTRFSYFDSLLKEDISKFDSFFTLAEVLVDVDAKN